MSAPQSWVSIGAASAGAVLLYVHGETRVRLYDSTMLLSLLTLLQAMLLTLLQARLLTLLQPMLLTLLQTMLLGRCRVGIVGAVDAGADGPAEH